ncbi:MAG: chemotaxis response regulator protein-glutamate methylesterase [Desulfobacterales bacterium]|nr:chemotaxis response regulator protein-glutamate methylesterase [Desulfobacterales bacterium]
MGVVDKLKVLVVDDTIVYRKIVTDVLTEIPEVEVVGTANNGKIALAKINSLKPDLVTLDIEMPEMNGIDVLSWIKKEHPEIGAIMVSTLTYEGGELTIKALELGAFDFISKPQGASMAENKKSIIDTLVPMIRAYSRRRDIRNILKGKPSDKITKSTSTPSPTTTTQVVSSKLDTVKQRLTRISRTMKPKSEIVAIGISTGGPNALAKMMPKLPVKINVPILIVQHMPPVFTQSLAKSLNTKCAINVREARDGEVLEPSVAYIAPGGKQMKIVASPDGKNRLIRITDDPPENSCKPSVDYLFRSISQYYLNRSTAVIMTGMGSDGFAGLKMMKQNGAFIIAQDELSCTVFGMPKEPIESGIVDVVASLDDIADEIVKTVKI